MDISTNLGSARDLDSGRAVAGNLKVDVAVKDLWIDPLRKYTEGMILHRLNQHMIEGIPQLVDEQQVQAQHYPVPGPSLPVMTNHSTHTLRSMLRHDYSTSNYHLQVLSRLVTQPVGILVTEFSCLGELLVAFLDYIVGTSDRAAAHKYALQKASVLHWDISLINLLLVLQEAEQTNHWMFMNSLKAEVQEHLCHRIGRLASLGTATKTANEVVSGTVDPAAATATGPPQTPTDSLSNQESDNCVPVKVDEENLQGTWSWMSAQLVMTGPGQLVVHDSLHNLESFFYTLPSILKMIIIQSDLTWVLLVIKHISSYFKPIIPLTSLRKEIILPLASDDNGEFQCKTSFDHDSIIDLVITTLSNLPDDAWVPYKHSDNGSSHLVQSDDGSEAGSKQGDDDDLVTPHEEMEPGTQPDNRIPVKAIGSVDGASRTVSVSELTMDDEIILLMGTSDPENDLCHTIDSSPLYCTVDEENLQGTWSWMSAQLVMIGPGQPVVHDSLHNLESFFYTLVGISVLLDQPLQAKDDDALTHCFDKLFNTFEPSILKMIVIQSDLTWVPLVIKHISSHFKIPLLTSLQKEIILLLASDDNGEFQRKTSFDHDSIINLVITTLSNLPNDAWVPYERSDNGSSHPVQSDDGSEAGSKQGDDDDLVTPHEEMEPGTVPPSPCDDAASHDESQKMAAAPSGIVLPSQFSRLPPVLPRTIATRECRGTGFLSKPITPNLRRSRPDCDDDSDYCPPTAKHSQASSSRGAQASFTPLPSDGLHLLPRRGKSTSTL
ncbi:hypothetical protein BDN67DRAFT_979440 [Paxillus ammoniavirescens]|nr:hypothetical protein BDN67DRAFT_979440 [Paxillus ammoniavirescens]